MEVMSSIQAQASSRTSFQIRKQFQLDFTTKSHLQLKFKMIWSLSMKNFFRKSELFSSQWLLTSLRSASLSLSMTITCYSRQIKLFAYTSSTRLGTQFVVRSKKLWAAWTIWEIYKLKTLKQRWQKKHRESPLKTGKVQSIQRHWLINL